MPQFWKDAPGILKFVYLLIFFGVVGGFIGSIVGLF